MVSSQRSFTEGYGLRSLALALLGVLLCIGGSSARAQAPDSSPSSEPQPQTNVPGAHRGLSLAQQLDLLTRQLHLTAEQQAQVKIILDRQHAEIEKLRKTQPLSAKSLFMNIDAVKRDALDKIDDLLTDEQHKIFRPNQSRPDAGGLPIAPARTSAIGKAPMQNAGASPTP